MTQDKQESSFSSNAIRLRLREWLIVSGIILVITTALPPVWRNLEAFSPSVDYRIPYDLSEDYWLFRQFSRYVCDLEKTLVIGDSVVWGHYVGRDRTLSHYLNELSGSGQFVNLGLDGSHPMALYGLVRHYGKAIKGEKIILHMNLLWLSSREADLQTDKEFQFNHPRLVPQFKPRIPCYTESTSNRMSIVLEQSVPFKQLVRHLLISGFDNTDLQLWTIENPYDNPLARKRIKPLGQAESPEMEAPSKSTKGQVPQSLPWVDFETSLQWWAFQRLVELLKSRDNEVFVAIGPLNEHVLTPDSVQKYGAILDEAERRLEQMNVLYLSLPLLPGRLYADASHPLPQGYSILADHIWAALSLLEKNSQGKNILR